MYLFFKLGLTGKINGDESKGQKLKHVLIHKVARHVKIKGISNPWGK